MVLCIVIHVMPEYALDILSLNLVLGGSWSGGLVLEHLNWPGIKRSSFTQQYIIYRLDKQISKRLVENIALFSRILALILASIFR